MESLYQISERYNNIVALLDDETTSVDDVAAAFAEVIDDVTTEGVNIIAYLQKLDDIEEQAKRQKKEIDAYLKGIANRKKRLEKACIFALDNMQVKSIMTSRGELKTKKNPPSVVIDDVHALPREYVSTKIDLVPDKVAIKNAIKAGQKVSGAHIEQGTSLSY